MIVVVVLKKSAKSAQMDVYAVDRGVCALAIKKKQGKTRKRLGGCSRGTIKTRIQDLGPRAVRNVCYHLGSG